MPVLNTITVAEAAERVNVNRDTIYSSVRDGRLRAVDCAGRMQIVEEDLEGFTQKTRGGPIQPYPTPWIVESRIEKGVLWVRSARNRIAWFPPAQKEHAGLIITLVNACGSYNREELEDADACHQ